MDNKDSVEEERCEVEWDKLVCVKCGHGKDRFDGIVCRNWMPISFGRVFCGCKCVFPSVSSQEASDLVCQQATKGLWEGYCKKPLGHDGFCSPNPATRADSHRVEIGTAPEVREAGGMISRSEVVKECERFLDQLKGRVDERADGAFVALTRLTRNIRSLPTEAAAGSSGSAEDTPVDEVQRRMDAVVDAAVKWRQGDVADNWEAEADALEEAVDSLLELRTAPPADSVGGK